MRPTRWSHDFLFYWILWILKLEYEECCFCTCTPYPSLYWTLWMYVRNTKVSYKRKRYNFPPFVLRYIFFLGLVFLENKSRNIGLLWNIVNTNARFYVGSRSFATIQTISAINMSTIFTNQFDTSTFYDNTCNHQTSTFRLFGTTFNSLFGSSRPLDMPKLVW